jgi:hypothetical protein
LESLARNQSLLATPNIEEIEFGVKHPMEGQDDLL